MINACRFTMIQQFISSYPNVSNDSNGNTFSGTQCAEKLKEIGFSTMFVNDMKKISPDVQTSSLEAFHALILLFAPKTTAYSYLGMRTRYESVLVWYIYMKFYIQGTYNKIPILKILKHLMFYLSSSAFDTLIRSLFFLTMQLEIIYKCFAINNVCYIVSICYVV